MIIMSYTKKTNYFIFSSIQPQRKAEFLTELESVMKAILENQDFNAEADFSVMDNLPNYFLSPEKHENIKCNVLKFIECNPFWKLSDVVEKFNLWVRFDSARWDDKGNGIGKFDLYTTDTNCGIKINVMPYYLPVKHQWNDKALENHPSNWEVVGWGETI